MASESVTSIIQSVPSLGAEMKEKATELLKSFKIPNKEYYLVEFITE